MKPIIFNTEMVKAILEGRKSRFTKVISYGLYIDYTDTMNEHSVEFAKNYCDLDDCSKDIKETFIKYHGKYKVDDVLYVKETFAIKENGRILYKADYEDGFDIKYHWRTEWRKSTHLKRENARIFLKVTNVRAERLQDIEFCDVFKEGIELIQTDGSDKACGDRNLKAFNNFVNLWDLTAKDGYKYLDNPYVFVYTFEKLQ